MKSFFLLAAALIPIFWQSTFAKEGAEIPVPEITARSELAFQPAPSEYATIILILGMSGLLFRKR